MVCVAADGRITLYSVSHDLRAPLRALAGFSAALLDECADGLGEVGRGYAGRIQAASEQMAKLIDDLLDLARMSKVEVNLLDNAWKFTSARDEASIDFAAVPVIQEAYLRCHVRDNGVGFDPAYLDKLFRPFQRLHPAREFPGTGVGLASVRQVVERHGGRVWAEGTAGGGATFYFTLQATEAV